MSKSKEQAYRFMMFTEVNEDLKQRYQSIMSKFEGKDLTKEEQTEIIRTEVMPLAKSIGFDFGTEDFRELLQPATMQLTDEELDKAVGGLIEFTTVDKKRHVCYFLDNSLRSAYAFRDYFFIEVGTCPHYVFKKHRGVMPDLHWCGSCDYYGVDHN